MMATAAAPPKARTKAQSPTCHECGKVFNEARQAKLTVRDYVRDGDEVRCLCEAACRGRVLHAYFESHGLKKWSRHTQEQLLLIMDLPPANWDKQKKWESSYDVRDRVLAAVEFYSTCYPVCLLYAVQTDADGEPIKAFGEWRHHTTRTLGTVLGVHQTTVARAIQYWADRNVLRWDDGRLYYDPEPKPLTLEKRRACTRISDDDLKDLHALLPSVLHILKDLRQKLDPDIWNPIYAVAEEACTQLNGDISDARSRASKTVLDACNGYVSLLSRETLESEPLRRAPSRRPKAPPSIPDEVRSVKPTPVNELYAAGLGKGALAKLPSPRPVIETTTTPVVVVVEKCDDDAKDVSYQKTTAPDFGQQVIAAFVAGGKPSPTAKQIRKLEQAIPDNPEARAGFVPFLEEKMPRTKHPGLLPNVAEEFNAAWPALMEREKAIREATRRREPSAPFTVEDLRYHLEAVAAAVPYPEILESLLILANNAEKHHADLEQLEQRLTVLEEKMLEIGRAGLTKEQADEVSRGVEIQLKPYRGKMTSSQLATLEAQYRERSVFEKAKLPRLSLFYMREKAQGAGQ